MRNLVLCCLAAFMTALFASSTVAYAQEDSLAVTEYSVAVEPAPVVVEGDTLFYIYSKLGGLTPAQRAEKAQEVILKTGKNVSFRSDTLHIEAGPYVTNIMYGDNDIFSITDGDAQSAGISRMELAERYHASIGEKIAAMKKTYGILQILKNTGLAILVVAIQVLLIRLTNFLFRKLRRKIIRLKHTKLKPIVLRDYEFLNTRRQSRILLFFSKLLKWVVILIQLMFSVPILFSIFPQTRSIAMTLFSYVFEPMKMIFWSIVGYIPNLFIIAIIYLCVRYIIKGIGYIFQEIESGKLKLGGFYPDWAKPTFNIIRFLLYAFMIAMIYQYLPGSDSGVFQGISVFVGLIISLGSSTVIGNIIAGFVITFMRPFKVGDRIKLNETEGNVIEKTPLVTRIRTPKNEIVTIPNSFVMASHTTNYSASARDYGLIIHIDVGVSYDTPRPVTLKLLIQAALDTPGVSARPEPFVLETALQESYAVYQINAYVKEVNQLAKIYSDLNQRIHDISNEAGMELILPRYYAIRDGNATVMPPEYLSRVQGKAKH